MQDLADLIAQAGAARHVVIAGPTASGKSALALQIAEATGGTIVNADALQVWSCWRVLSARPSCQDESRAPHALYGHVAPGADYSVGHWLRELAALKGRLIITGGTGLYLTALTEGLAEIPPTPPEIRARADARLAAEGAPALLAELDAPTAARIDKLNPARIQRAWEVLQATGRGLAEWQATTPAPLIGADQALRLVLDVPPARLAERIALRFDLMMEGGAVEEARAVLPYWDPAALWAKAIGAPELIAHLRGELTRQEARDLAVIATRQFAKRQRSWFRNRMKHWQRVALPA